MDLVAIYNLTYARRVRIYAADWDTASTHPLDLAGMEGDLIEAHDKAAAHVERVATARNSRIASLGIPMWDHYALLPTATTMTDVWSRLAAERAYLDTFNQCAGPEWDVADGWQPCAVHGTDCVK